MISNFIIIVYLASWTFFIILLILIGYMLDRSYKLTSIYPQVQNKSPGETTFAIQPNAQKVQTQQATKYENQELDDFFNNMGDHTPQVNYEEQLFNNIERNGTENNSPLRVNIDQKQVSSPRTNRSIKRSNTAKKSIMRKPTIGTYEGIETIQTTNRKSLQVQKSGARLSQVNSERNSVSDLTPRSNGKKQQKQNYPRVSQFSIFGRNEQIKIDPNYKIPKPDNDFYKCHQFSKIFYSHKEEMSRIFQILTIYFRQIFCLDCCGIIIKFFPNFNEWINIGITGGIFLLLKILDYYMIKAIAHHRHSKLFKYIQYLLWLISIGIITWLLIFDTFNNFMWLIEYLPSLLLDIIFIDPLKYVLIKHCLSEPRKIREPKIKVDVIKVMQQIK